jgi:hypothetical protein
MRSRARIAAGSDRIASGMTWLNDRGALAAAEHQQVDHAFRAGAR